MPDFDRREGEPVAARSLSVPVHRAPAGVARRYVPDKQDCSARWWSMRAPSRSCRSSRRVTGAPDVRLMAPGRSAARCSATPGSSTRCPARGARAEHPGAERDRFDVETQFERLLDRLLDGLGSDS